MHVLALLADLENNRIPGADVQRRMAGLLEELDRLGRDRLPVIGRELTAARKTAQADWPEKGTGPIWRSPDGPPQIGPVPFSGRVGASLAAAAGQQDAVIAALEQWLGQLARWQSYGRFHREIAQLLREQEELTRRTAEVGRRTLAQDLRDLGPQDAAELNDRRRRGARIGPAARPDAARDGAGGRPTAARRSAGRRHDRRRPGPGPAAGRRRGDAHGRRGDRAEPDRPGGRRPEADRPGLAGSARHSRQPAGRGGPAGQAAPPTRRRSVGPGRSGRRSWPSRSTPRPDAGRTRRPAAASWSGLPRSSNSCGKRPSGWRGNSSGCSRSRRRPPPGGPRNKWTRPANRRPRGTAPGRAAGPPRPGNRWPRPAASLPTGSARPRPSWPSSSLPGSTTPSSTSAASSRTPWKRPAGSGSWNALRGTSPAPRLRRWAIWPGSSTRSGTTRPGLPSNSPAPGRFNSRWAARRARCRTRPSRSTAARPVRPRKSRNSVRSRQLDLVVEAIKPEPPAAQEAGGRSRRQRRPASNARHRHPAPGGTQAAEALAGGHQLPHREVAASRDGRRANRPRSRPASTTS